MAIYKIPDSMRVGPPVLRVRNIDTAMAFYENSLGLQVNRSYKDNSPGGGYYDDVNPIYEVGFKHKFSSSFSFSSSSSFSYEPLLILKHDPNAKKPSLKGYSTTDSLTTLLVNPYTLGILKIMVLKFTVTDQLVSGLETVKDTS
jgi:hypothetical protein